MKQKPLNIECEVECSVTQYDEVGNDSPRPEGYTVKVVIDEDTLIQMIWDKGIDHLIENQLKETVGDVSRFEIESVNELRVKEIA